MDALGLADIHLVGMSMGSLICATYAAQFSHRVSSASLMCLPGKGAGQGRAEGRGEE